MKALIAVVLLSLAFIAGVRVGGVAEKMKMSDCVRRAWIDGQSYELIHREEPTWVLSMHADIHDYQLALEGRDSDE
jgi:hypothetical protein